MKSIYHFLISFHCALQAPLRSRSFHFYFHFRFGFPYFLGSFPSEPGALFIGHQVQASEGSLLGKIRNRLTVEFRSVHGSLNDSKR